MWIQLLPKHYRNLVLRRSNFQTDTHSTIYIQESYLKQKIHATATLRNNTSRLVIAFAFAVAGAWRNDDVRVAVAIVNTVARAFVDDHVSVIIAVVRAVASFLGSGVVAKRSGEHGSSKRKSDKSEKPHIELTIILERRSL